jgi:Glycosyl transferases group 1
MKTICFISHVHFWHRRSGGMERDLRLLDYLSRHFILKMIYLGQFTAGDALAISKLSLSYQIHDIGTGRESEETDWIHQFQQQSAEIRNADVYIIGGIKNSYMLDALPEAALSFLDTKDLVSERSRKASNAGNVLAKITREEEIAIFRRFNQVICIQEDEAKLAAQWIGSENVITAKHPVKCLDSLPERNRQKIGLIASNWAPNAYGLRDFAINCWPTIRKTGATLDVYGSISQVLTASLPAVTFHGYVDNLEQCYAELGVIINPVQYGAGLKIKSIEAMAHGLPLVTSREGASGIEHLDGNALVIADSWNDFSDRLIELMRNESRCRGLANNALVYIAEHFNDEACFADLREKIEFI